MGERVSNRGLSPWALLGFLFLVVDLNMMTTLLTDPLLEVSSSCGIV